MFKKIDAKMNLPAMEEEILKFWEENKIFEKSIENRKEKPLYSFYDGPPFATGTPHYGHIVGSVMKDVVPRFWTMKGFRVERKWGWDCHGLPIENIAEKELGVERKKDIEEMGIDKFNEFCRSKVLNYVSEWKKVITRLGRWADMENDYKTMDLSYMESIWWVFKELWNKGLIYEGYQSMHICTRCETTLSQQEVSEGYKDIKDLSVIAKFELMDELGTFVLAWTTTPWTLIGNVALAIGKNIDYIKVSIDQDAIVRSESEESGIRGKLKHSIIDNATYICSKEYFLENENLYIPAFIKEGILDNYNQGDEIDFSKFKYISVLKGSDLIGKKYKPLFSYYSNKGLQNEDNGWQIYSADFVTTEEGTGVVHIAPAFGEDDLNLSYQYKLPFIQHVGMDGIIKSEATDFEGLSVKPMNDHQKTDIEVIKFLARNSLLFAKEKYEHSYPHCWRCDTPLINYATSSWFVKVLGVKERALELAKEINWSPKHIKEGRFGNWMAGARDWSISRQRYWASVIPIWKCECGEIKVFGSVAELEKLSGQKMTDLHKHIVDKIIFKCEKCQKEMKRIPDVLDTWFDSGSMPYAQMHYPFENQKKFEQNFPAEFIAEGEDQCRAWFYYLHILGTALKDKPAFKNVIVNGTVVGTDGKKLSKRLKNYPDPVEMLEKYGADAMRFYLLSSPVVVAENLIFKESDVSDLVRGMFRMLWNSYSFFVLYANIDNFSLKKDYRPDSKNLLDKWIVSELQVLIKEFNGQMENYQLHKAARLIPGFIDNLSNWYIRRSRKRFWKSENDDDKNNAYQTLHYVLITLSKVIAPFTPFVAEEMYKNLTGEESVHLVDFPLTDEKLIDEKLNKNMSDLREIITLGLQNRAKNGIKVRQPLKRVVLGQKYIRIFDEMISKSEWKNILTEELNIKEVELGVENENVVIDTEITPELKLEGRAREIIRYIQEMRKEAGYEVDNRINIGYVGASDVFSKFGELVARETLANNLEAGELFKADLKKEFKFEKEIFSIAIKRAGV